MKRWPSAAFACLMMMLGWACRRPPLLGPREAITNPAEVFAAVRRREAMVHSLRARFSAEVHRADGVRRADGVLLVRKPDRFRVRLLSAFGLTVFDYVSWGKHARMELPLEGKQFTDAQIAQQSAFSPADMGAAFLRADDAPGQCLAQAGTGQTVVECRDAGGALVRLMQIDSRNQTVRQEISFADARPQLVMQFDDYRRVGTAELPFTIDLTYPQRGVSMKISVRSYDVNPNLPDSLFAAATG